MGRMQDAAAAGDLATIRSMLDAEQVGLYPILTLQYSSTTLYHFYDHIK
jgi:hypothetical protein